MTLELELSPELEAQLRAESALRHVPVETMAAHVLSAGLAFSNRYSLPIEAQIMTGRAPSYGLNGTQSKEQAREAAIDAGFGMFAGVGPTVDEFLAERHAEGKADYLKWLEGQNQNAPRENALSEQANL